LHGKHQQFFTGYQKKFAPGTGAAITYRDSSSNSLQEYQQPVFYMEQL
jgi:hypothetical protein